MFAVSDEVNEAYNAGVFEGNRNALYRDIFKWSQDLRRGEQVHMNIAAKLDDFAEGWRIGQSVEITNMNLESGMDVRDNICRKIERLCDAMSWVADILRRQLAVEVDIADMLVTISVHVGRCRYFLSSTSLQIHTPMGWMYSRRMSTNCGGKSIVIILFVRFLLP